MSRCVSLCVLDHCACCSEAELQVAPEHSGDEGRVPSKVQEQASHAFTCQFVLLLLIAQSKPQDQHGL
eukprot:5839288-Amphidinium_carterae.1